MSASSETAPVQTASPRAVTPPSAPRVAARLSGIALLLFLTVGLVSTLVAVVTGRLDLLPDGVTRNGFISGDTMRGIASALAKAPPAKLAAELEREGSFVAIGDLGPQVREGCHGWLFLAEELMPQPDAEAHLQARAEVVREVQAALNKRGIKLLLVTVPDKSRIEHDRLCSLVRPSSVNGRLSEWQRTLQAGGIATVNLTPALAAMKAGGKDPFFRTDTHWTERGAQTAAQTVAQAVRGFDLSNLPPQSTDITQSPPARRPGDLVHLAGIDGLPLALQPKPENATDSRFTTRAAADVAGQAPGEADLFGDGGLPAIALIGTSFSRNSHFADFLAHELGTPVPDLALDGGNFWGAASAYFAGPAFRDTPPKLVIWEIPERVLQLPTAGEHWIIP